MLIRLLKLLWIRWKAVAHRVATLQARALLFLFYYTVLAPFALGMRLLSDPLRLHPDAPRGWLPRPPQAGDITLTARRQF
jgi:hypothetical protein